MKSAIVTGGNRGIGAAIGQRLAKDGIAVTSLDIEDPHSPVDVTDSVSLAKGLERHARQYGGPDILICNAGMLGPAAPVEDFDPAIWRQIIDINLTGTFLTCQAALPYLKRRGWGRIVMIGSLAGKEGTPNAAAYSASKAGMMTLAKSLGKELAGSGILVNAIAPAAVETDLLAQTTAEHVQIMIDKSPLKRLGQVEEVAELTAWLASEHCTFSTGAVFDLSGGRATY